MSIRVLVVDDEPLAAQAHRSFVERVPGFAVAGVCLTAADTMWTLGLRRRPGAGDPPVAVDVILLDLNLPDGHGLDVVRALRSTGHPADVIAVTSARDLALVRASVSLGIVQYLLKPFAFAALRDRLERYAAYREQVGAVATAASQDEVDRALSALRTTISSTLPKGLSQPSLDAVAAAMRAAAGPAGTSAAELAGTVGMSRVTARRYLEHLVEAGAATRATRYGGAGRPEVEYSLIG